MAVAKRNPRTGECIGPAGQIFKQSNLVTPAKLWQDLLPKRFERGSTDGLGDLDGFERHPDDEWQVFATGAARSDRMVLTRKK